MAYSRTSSEASFVLRANLSATATNLIPGVSSPLRANYIPSGSSSPAIMRSSNGGSSSSSSSSEKTYVVIFYTLDHLLIRLCVDSLIPLEKNDNFTPLRDLENNYRLMPYCDPSALIRDFSDLLPPGSSIHDSMCTFVVCTTSIAGGLGPYIFVFRNSNDVYRYNLHQPDTSCFHKCADMPVAIHLIKNALSVQIGDFFYWLSFAGGNQPTLQKYDIKNDIWTLVKDDIITKCNYKERYNISLGIVPHVVIDRKLHISFGYNAFAFDTETDTWEYSNLFEKIWLRQNSPRVCIWGLNQPGLEFCDQTFRFYGRGVVWDDDILLGIRYSSEYQLVAFQLLDNKAVNSQFFTFITDKEFDSVKLLDLGRGYFGLMHVTSCYRGCMLELLTIVVSKSPQPRADHFLECQIVSKDCVALNFPYNVATSSNVFCVSSDYFSLFPCSLCLRILRL